MLPFKLLSVNIIGKEIGKEKKKEFLSVEFFQGKRLARKIKAKLKQNKNSPDSGVREPVLNLALPLTCSICYLNKTYLIYWKFLL